MSWLRNKLRRWLGIDELALDGTSDFMATAKAIMELQKRTIELGSEDAITAEVIAANAKVLDSLIQDVHNLHKFVVSCADFSDAFIAQYNADHRKGKREKTKSKR